MKLTQEFVDSVHAALRKIGHADAASFALEADQPITNLGLDSAALIELVGLLEEKSGRTIDDRQLADMRTLGDLQKLLEA